MRRFAILVHIGMLLAGPLSAQTPAEAARKAVAEYEAGLRKNAVFRPEPVSMECDEKIGRSCVWWDTSQHPLPAEPGKVTSARNNAIVKLTAAFKLAPDSAGLAYPLVRYLAQARRFTESVDAARIFAGATKLREGHMLLGYALHMAGQTEEALREFELWLQDMPVAERNDITDLRWLISPAERGDRQRMTQLLRDEYEKKVWRFADALYITPGNETLADHYARHALVYMTKALPTAAQVESWDVDMEELLIRFGPIIRVTRAFAGGSIGVSENFHEHWDPAEHTYVPPVLDSVLAMRATVDTLWPVDTLIRRSGHAPPTIRLMRVLQHQAAVFGLGTLQLIGVAEPDTALSSSTTAAVFVLDKDLNLLDRKPLKVGITKDSILVTGDVSLPEAARFYSAEIFDPVTRYAARARFRIEPVARAGQIALSGLLLTQPFEPGALPENRVDTRMKPLSRPVLSPGSKFGVYADLMLQGADKPRTISVELEARSIDRPSSITKLAGWIGAKLGFASGKSPARLGWNVEVEPGKATPVAVTIDPGKLEPGRYLVTLEVTDPAGGSSAIAERELLVTSGGALRSHRR